MHISQTSDHYIFNENGFRLHLRVSIIQKFTEGHAPRPPSFSMLCMLIVLCTILLNSPLETAQKRPTPILYGPSPLQS